MYFESSLVNFDMVKRDTYPVMPVPDISPGEIRIWTQQRLLDEYSY